MQGAAARAEKQGRLEKKELQEKLESIESQMKVVKIFKALSVLLCVWGSTVSRRLLCKYVKKTWAIGLARWRRDRQKGNKSHHRPRDNLLPNNML